MEFKLGIDMCCFNEKHAGGKDEVAYNLLRGFDKIGVSENVICFCYKSLVPILAKVNPNVKVHIVPEIHIKKVPKRVNFFFRSYYIKYAAAKLKIDVLLFPNKPSPNISYSMPTVLIPHDIEVFENGRLPGVKYTSKQYNRGIKDTLRDFRNRDRVIAISDFDKDEMIKFMPWAEKKIQRIYDPIVFEEKTQDSDDVVKEYITCLNIRWEHKNIITVIKAFREIASRINYKLILVGNPPLNIGEIKKYINDNGLSSRIIFTGFVSDEELSDIIRKTRLYVNSSYFEGFGMTAIEMMGRCVPTIVAKSTAMPETTMGLCRYYEPTDDYHALAKEMLNEISEPTPRAELSEISNKVREKYSYEVIAKEYWDMIKNCIELS